MQMTNDEKTNIRRLTNYINSQPDPVSFATALFTAAALIKPHFDNARNDSQVRPR